MKREIFYAGWYLLICAPVLFFYIAFYSRSKKDWHALTGRLKPRVSPGRQDREYIRLDSVFPVEFQKVGFNAEGRFEARQGFTRNISRSGMCIEALAVRGGRFEEMIPNETRLNLIINIPLESKATIARGIVRWVDRSEDMAVDRYLIGVSYENISEYDMARIMRYALWLRRRPELFAAAIIIMLAILAAFLSASFVSGNEKALLARKVDTIGKEKLRLVREKKAIEAEKRSLETDLEAASKRYELLLEKPKNAPESKIAVSEKKDEKEPLEKVPPEFAPENPEPAVTEVQETTYPIVELVKPVFRKDKAKAENGITQKMIDSERSVLNHFRDYVLNEDVQLLDGYCSGHRTSIYHAAGLFALAELRYKKGNIIEMATSVYKDVIMLYPGSKYASYASHRLDQISKNLPYSVYTLKSFYLKYSLPPLFDYRELEPYKK